MNLPDILLLLLIALAVFFALRSVWKQKKNGRPCCGDCSACRSSCGDKNSFKS